MVEEHGVNLLGIRLEITPVWGFSVRAPFAAAAQQAYLLPPPSSLIGAFLAAIGKLQGWPEVALDVEQMVTCSGGWHCCESRCFKAAAIGFPKRFGDRVFPLVTYSDILNQPRLVYAQQFDRDFRAAQFTGPQMMGRVYGYNPDMPLQAIYIVKRNVFEQEELKRALYGITHIGSKESCIHVNTVEFFDVTELSNTDYLETTYYTPKEVIRTRGGYLTEAYWRSFDHWKGPLRQGQLSLDFQEYWLPINELWRIKIIHGRVISSTAKIYTNANKCRDPDYTVVQNVG